MALLGTLHINSEAGSWIYNHPIIKLIFLNFFPYMQFYLLKNIPETIILLEKRSVLFEHKCHNLANIYNWCGAIRLWTCLGPHLQVQSWRRSLRFIYNSSWLHGNYMSLMMLIRCVDSLQHHGLYSTRLLSAWDSPGKNTGMGCHFLSQWILPTQGWNLNWSVWWRKKDTPRNPRIVGNQASWDLNYKDFIRLSLFGYMWVPGVTAFIN